MERARRGRGGGPCAGVEDDLVVGVAVDGGHDAGGDAEGVVENLDDRREAVGGAARVRDDLVLGGVVLSSLTPRTTVRSSLVAGAR